MRRILIPTDFSDPAWNAIAYAMQLFRNMECTFYIVNTYTPAIPSNRFMALSNGVPLEDTLGNASENGLLTIVGKIKVHFGNPKHTFRTISSFSLLIDEMKEVVDHHKITLIVAGTKGASGLDEVFLGSNTVRMIKGIKTCPVLAVPKDFTFAPLAQVALAADLDRFYPQSELRPLLHLARACNATIHIVHVQKRVRPLSELQRFNLDMLLKSFGAIPNKVHRIPEVRSISGTLNTFSQELGAQLLVMLHYRHGYMERITEEPVVKTTAFHTQIPLLVLPEMGLHPPLQQEKERVQTL